MIEIHPNALYSRQDLQEALRPLGVDADTFTARICPRRVFRAFLVGQDILDALAKAPALKVHTENPTPPGARRRGSRRRKVEDGPGMQALQNAIDQVKGRAGHAD